MGEFVGRHAELRELLGSARRPGLVVHGMPGIGKSRLVTELLPLLERERPGGRTVRVPGSATVAEVMIALGEARPVTEPIILVVDDFAAVPRPGTGGRAEPVDAGLTGFLTAWVREAGPRRLVMTSRYPVTLPGDAHRGLAELHLGPLTGADARLLMKSLPSLSGLGADEQARAWAFCGGNPRALEDLDTLLGHGGEEFAGLAERLERVLADNGVVDPARWVPSLQAGRDEAAAGRALAEAITTIVDDILVGELLSVRQTAYRDADTADRGLAVDEQLGRRAGLAGWQRLGLPGGADDPAAIEHHLRQALAVDAERGNRAAMASGLHRLGVVCALTGRLPAAVTLHCRALATELALSTPEAPIELADLSRLRAALGDAPFRRAAAEVLPAESLNGLVRMLDNFVVATESRLN
ncbi:ATP-binding protein [Actinoplanes sp. M2I2]|uniref:ATP-binding protein n=1 Tax=Actinoplanes sp. M2I2 TaxID=1734444 RepID=UPI00201FD332|nr:ATP-binding protein [Actinoplanes sp. M2I2]